MMDDVTKGVDNVMKGGATIVRVATTHRLAAITDLLLDIAGTVRDRTIGSGAVASWWARCGFVRSRDVIQLWPLRPVGTNIMPAKSKAQQKAAGAALSAKRGATAVGDLKGASKSMYDSMSEKQLDEIASTKRKGKPEHKSKVRT